MIVAISEPLSSYNNKLYDKSKGSMDVVSQELLRTTHEQILAKIW